MLRPSAYTVYEVLQIALENSVYFDDYLVYKNYCISGRVTQEIK